MLMRAAWSSALVSVLDEQRSTSSSYTKHEYFREIEISKRMWPDLHFTPKEMIIDSVASSPRRGLSPDHPRGH
jgi:hypothetical protein